MVLEGRGGRCVGEGLNAREARWFSQRLDPGSTPWVLEKET